MHELRAGLVASPARRALPTDKQVREKKKKWKKHQALGGEILQNISITINSTVLLSSSILVVVHDKSDGNR